MLDADLVSDARAELAESPQWYAPAQQLLWVDINPGIVHRLDPATGSDQTTQLGPTVGAVAPRRDGGLAVALRRGFALLDADDSRSFACDVEQGPDGNRMNDGKCDPAGRFWAGSMAMSKTSPDGSLYRLDTDLSTTRVLSGVWVSNGLAWSLDAKRMYYIDSLAGGIDEFRFDLDTGDLAERRRLVDVPFAEGEADGMTIDADGCLWVAVWRAGQVRRYTPEGRLDTVIRVPASLVTSCCFGGASMDELYITTARCDLTPAQRAAQPLAGGLFVASTGTSGFAATPFAA